jgi:predicted alpha/beta-hydrolase family hydrolase
MPSQPLQIARSRADLPPLSALLDEPTDDAAGEIARERRRSVVLLAHGSGVDIEHPWMRRAAEALAARGFAVLRFRYPYMEHIAREGKPRPPDRAPQLEDAHFDALAELRRRFPGRRWLLAGKSLGARIATHVAAKGADAHGLVLFGYPLHPPGKPDKERSEHFATLAQPALFLHGTRDEFGSVDELRAALRRYSGRAELSVVDGADHSFAQPVSKRRDLASALDELAARTADWDSRTFPE